MSTTVETAITRLLDARGIRYRILPHANAVFTVEAAARERGTAPELHLKSILLRDKAGRFAMACLRGVDKLDARALRTALDAGAAGGWKKLAFANDEEIARVTGCPRGAVTPIGLPADVPVVFDLAVPRSGPLVSTTGDPMAGLELDAAEMLALVRPALARIAEPAAGAGTA